MRPLNTYKRHRFPPHIISYAVWQYFRFDLSHSDIEDLSAEQGTTVGREVIRTIKQSVTQSALEISLAPVNQQFKPSIVAN